jgi:hypothetical protein
MIAGRSLIVIAFHRASAPAVLMYVDSIDGERPWEYNGSSYGYPLALISLRYWRVHPACTNQ